MFVPTLINLLYNLSFSNKYFIRFRGNKQKRKMNKTKMKRSTTSITQNLEIKKLDWLFSGFVVLFGDVRRHGHQSFKPVSRLMSYKLNLNFPCGWLIIKNDDKGALQKAIS